MSGTGVFISVKRFNVLDFESSDKPIGSTSDFSSSSSVMELFLRDSNKL